jgi:hypothetical protein
MKRFEKIVLEQARKSKPGTIGQTVSTDAVNQKAKQLKAISFLLYYVFGKKESPIDKQKVASVLPRISIYGDNSIYSRGEYFYVIGEDYKEKEGTNKAVMYFPIYIIRQTESDIEILNKFRIGGTDKAPIIDINDFQNIQDAVEKKKAEAEAKEKADAEAKAKADAEAKAKADAEAKKQVSAIRSALANSENIDVSQVGTDKPKGTQEQKAFQELLYQVGLKLAPASNPEFANFAKLRLFRTSGKYEFGGVFGPKTKKLLWRLNLLDDWNKGRKKLVLNSLRGELLLSLNAKSITNESTNYFKGTGMNIKLKDLLQEHLLKEQVMTRSADETYPGNDSSTSSTEKTTTTSTEKTTPTSTEKTTPTSTTDSPEDIDNLYTQSVAETEDILLKFINYVNDHSQFAGYKAFDDDEAAALKDLVKPWVQSNIQPKVINYYNKYIEPYMDMYNVPNDALNVEYDWEYVGTNDSVTNISNEKFRKIIQNGLILKANSSNTALNHPTTSAAYYNYAGDESSYTIPCMFYYNYARSVHYWNLAGGRAVFNVDTDF